MSVGGSTGDGTTETHLDPQMLAAWQTLNDQAKKVSAGMVGGAPDQKLAPQDTNYKQADAYLDNQVLNNAGMESINQASQLANQVGNYDPTQVKTQSIDPAQVASVAPAVASSFGGADIGKLAKADTNFANTVNLGQANAYDPSKIGQAKDYDAATIDPSNIGKVDATTLGDAKLKQYTDPYQQQVADQTTQDFLHGLKLQQQDDKASAIAAHAFGGSREGVQRAQTEEAADRTLASTLANLNSQGFAQATGLAEQDLDRGLQADTTNQGARLQVATANQGAKNTAGQFGATVQNTADLADQASVNQARAANNAAQNTFDQQTAANKMATDQFNSTNANATSQYNTGQENNAVLTRAQFDQQAGINNSGLQTDIAKLNATTAADRATHNADLSQQGALANQTANLSAQTSNQGAGLTGNSQVLGASQELGALGTAEHGLKADNVGLLNTQGGIDQAQAQKGLDNTYANQMADYLAPLQALQAAALPFGIIPTTANGGTSSTNSSAKNAALGG